MKLEVTGRGSSIGGRHLRREDARLLRGQGRFVDDVDVAGQLWMRVVRSAVASASVDDIDAGAALALDGVVAVISGRDVADIPPIPIRLGPREPAFDPFLQPVLAQGRVRYVGEPVAVVLAEDPYAAEDAAELVHVTYGDAGDAPTERVVARLQRSDGDPSPAPPSDAVEVEVEVEISRHSAVPLETRGLVAAFEPKERRLTIWGSTKVPHFNRGVIAAAVGLPVDHVSMRSTDAGGGFGVRGELYPEDLLVPLLAVRTERPVKWVEDRTEHLVATNHSREQRHRLSGTFSRDGTLLSLQDEVRHDNGAYLRTHGVLVPEMTLSMLPGPYRVPAYEGAVDVVLSNKTPAGTYRAPGRYEGTFARERLLDAAAARLGMDPVELRRRNLLTDADVPLRRSLPVLGHDVHIDSGDPSDLLERTLAEAGYDGWVREAERARADGALLGNGVACFLEKSGGGGHEGAAVTVGLDGRIRVDSGGASLGQGIETVLAQTVAEVLGVPLDDIDVRCGDTDRVGHGGGSWASRSTIYSGTAALRAAEDVASRARAVAAELLEASVEDVVLERGQVTIAGAPDRGLSLTELARACHPGTSSAPFGLTATATARQLGMTYPYGVHLAQVRIDPKTGGVAVARYFVGYEVGRAVNPMLVEGQLIGGVAQGIGGALLEELRYDEDGQPTSTTFMDYLIPTAQEVPHVGVLVREDAPSPGNPLGVKGAGEGGTTAVGAAVAAAIDDALGRPGAVTRLPVRPADVLRLLAAARR